MRPVVGRRAAASRLLFRVTVVTVAVWAILGLAALNWRLYRPGGTEATIAQLRFLTGALGDGAAERMQGMFPEGYVFTWALYGLAAAQVLEAVPPGDERRSELLAAAQNSVVRVCSDRARGGFSPNLRPRYGAFYASWSLYLRSVVLQATAPDGPVPFDLRQYEADCDSLAAALAAGDSPFLQSYPGQVWPGDTGVGVAGLAIRDAVLGGTHGPVIERWLEAVRRRLDPASGAIPHASGGQYGMPREGPRGESLALLSRVLVDVDPELARDQYRILRRDFVARPWGLPGVRVFPIGRQGRGDIDSGPVVLGLGGPATVVGIGAALANGDTELAKTLLAVSEGLGFPMQWAGRRRYLGGVLPVGDAFLAWARSTPASLHRVGYPRAMPRWWRLPFHVVSLLLVTVLLYALIRMSRRWHQRRQRLL